MGMTLSGITHCLLQTRLTWVFEMKIDIYRVWVHTGGYIESLGNKDPKPDRNNERRYSRFFCEFCSLVVTQNLQADLGYRSFILRS